MPHIGDIVSVFPGIARHGRTIVVQAKHFVMNHQCVLTLLLFSTYGTRSMAGGVATIL